MPENPLSSIKQFHMKAYPTVLKLKRGESNLMDARVVLHHGKTHIHSKHGSAS